MSHLKDSPMAGGSVSTTSVGVVDGGSAMVGFIVGAEIGSIIPGIEKNTASLNYENKCLIIHDGDNKLCQTKILKGFRETFYYQACKINGIARKRVSIFFSEGK